MKLTHPKSKQTIEVDESRKGVYLSQGWKPVKSRSRKADDQNGGDGSPDGDPQP